MSMEDAVRAQHNFEDRLAKFQAEIDEFMRLSFRELDVRQHEVAMARLIDFMDETTGNSERLDQMFKGLLLKRTYDRRKAGDKPSFFSTIFIKRYYKVNDFIKWKFRYPMPLTENLAHDLAAGNHESTRNLQQQ